MKFGFLMDFLFFIFIFEKIKKILTKYKFKGLGFNKI